MTKIKETQMPLKFKIIMAVIFLAAMNFFLYGSYLVMLAFAMCVLYRNKNFVVPKGSVYLILFSMSYNFFMILTSSEINLRVIAAPCAYLAAYNLYDDAAEYDSEKVLTVITYAMALHSLLSFIYLYRTQGINSFSQGAGYDIWSGSSSTSTGIAANYYFLAATVPMLLMKGKWHHYIIYILALIHDILLGGRTFLVLSGISVLLTFVLRVFLEKKRVSVVIKYVIAFGIIACVLIIIYQKNIFDIRNTFESSYMWRRFFSANPYEKLNETSRWERKYIYLQNLFTYPFGGGHMRNDLGVGYAHDIWLDTFDNAGVITMIILLFYSITSIFRFLRYSKICQTVKEKIVFYVLPIVLTAAFFVEPIMDGCPMVFFMYCFMDGFVSKKLERGYVAE